MPMNGDFLPKENEVSLYIHVPFCKHKCAYCHFYVIPDRDIHKSQLLEGLKLEWDNWRSALKGKRIVSVYFGGGTPALFGAQAIGEVLSWLPLSSNDIEITLEANPENVTPTQMKEYAAIGINRMSIGIQTFDPHLLKILERQHTPQKAQDAVLMAANAGIRNISVDLMYDLPGQTLSNWQETLKHVQQLPITHLSLYNLTIEPHTVFFKYRDAIAKKMPDQEISLHMYEMAIETLSSYGLEQYEISAFAKPGYHSRHNVGYWTARPFLGLGPSAFSFWNDTRFRNVANLSRYCRALKEARSPIDFEEKLPKDALRRELLVVQLRLLAGVDLDEFQKRHGTLEKETLATLEKLKSEGLLKWEKNNVRLSEKGILFYDAIAVAII